MSLDNDVTLEGGALVKQRLKYHYYSAAFDMGKVEWTGAWHNHYPEWKEGIKWLETWPETGFSRVVSYT